MCHPVTFSECRLPRPSRLHAPLPADGELDRDPAAGAARRRQLGRRQLPPRRRQAQRPLQGEGGCHIKRPHSTKGGCVNFTVKNLFEMRTKGRVGGQKLKNAYVIFECFL